MFSLAVISLKMQMPDAVGYFTFVRMLLWLEPERALFGDIFKFEMHYLTVLRELFVYPL